MISPSKATCTIKVLPNASKNALVGWENHLLKIRICAQPEKGKANEAIISFLAKELGIQKKQIQIVRGDKSRHKLVAFEGISQEELTSLLEAKLR